MSKLRPKSLQSLAVCASRVVQFNNYQKIVQNNTNQAISSNYIPSDLGVWDHNCLELRTSSSSSSYFFFLLSETGNGTIGVPPRTFWAMSSCSWGMWGTSCCKFSVLALGPSSKGLCNHVLGVVVLPFPHASMRSWPLIRFKRKNQNTRLPIHLRNFENR